MNISFVLYLHLRNSTTYSKQEKRVLNQSVETSIVRKLIAILYPGSFWGVGGGCGCVCVCVWGIVVRPHQQKTQSGTIAVCMQVLFV